MSYGGELSMEERDYEDACYREDRLEERRRQGIYWEGDDEEADYLHKFFTKCRWGRRKY